MRFAMLGLGILGLLVGLVMIIAGASSREVKLDPIIHGFLISVVSLVILIIAKVFINHRR